MSAAPKTNVNTVIMPKHVVAVLVMCPPLLQDACLTRLPVTRASEKESSVGQLALIDHPGASQRVLADHTHNGCRSHLFRSQRNFGFRLPRYELVQSKQGQYRARPIKGQPALCPRIGWRLGTSEKSGSGPRKQSLGKHDVRKLLGASANCRLAEDSIRS
jgi:hypothetical protein